MPAPPIPLGPGRSFPQQQQQQQQQQHQLAAAQFPVPSLQPPIPMAGHDGIPHQPRMKPDMTQAGSGAISAGNNGQRGPVSAAPGVHWMPQQPNVGIDSMPSAYGGGIPGFPQPQPQLQPQLQPPQQQQHQQQHHAGLTTATSTLGMIGGINPQLQPPLPSFNVQQNDVVPVMSRSLLPSRAQTHQRKTSTLSNESSIIREFQYLVFKGRELFEGIRLLPPVGRRPWKEHFTRAFEIFGRLWRLQLKERTTLASSDRYQLQRHEIGDICSKLGQLFYHYYTRSSDTNYLVDAHRFYEAIHERRYFDGVIQLKDRSLVIKMIRYYARHAVTSILLGKPDQAVSVVNTIMTMVEQFKAAMDDVATDYDDWRRIVAELATFVTAWSALIPSSGADYPLPLDIRHPASLRSSRRVPGALPAPSADTQQQSGATAVSSPSAHESSGQHHGVRQPSEWDFHPIRLQEAILIGNVHRQVQFTEMKIDVLRICQSLECEPPKGERSHTSALDSHINDESTTTGGPNQQSGTSKTSGDKKTGVIEPVKYILHRPPVQNTLMYLGMVGCELGDDTAMLVYASSDGMIVNPVSSDEPEDEEITPIKEHSLAHAYSAAGGIMLTDSRRTNNRRKAAASSSSSSSDPSAYAVPSCLHPADLVPFTRYPMFLIIESSNSQPFLDLPRPFGEDIPIMCLASPSEYPVDTELVGGLFTLFLSSSVQAFAFLTGITGTNVASLNQPGPVSQAWLKRGHAAPRTLLEHAPNPANIGPVIDSQMWLLLHEAVEGVEKRIYELLFQHATDRNIRRFMADPITARYIVRFVFCRLVLAQHIMFGARPEDNDPDAGERMLPKSMPPIPSEVMLDEDLTKRIHDVIRTADFETGAILGQFVTTQELAEEQQMKYRNKMGNANTTTAATSTVNASHQDSSSMDIDNSYGSSSSTATTAATTTTATTTATATNGTHKP
ncbi:hypothetical protein GQ42DRAFT_162242 [Ramicandelaber brevisporus]|nr:hypothetical protein GQ42DRAFT_162242 [Ramicandelaber brevisporus]